MPGTNDDKKKSEKVIKETVADYTVGERTPVTKSRKKSSTANPDQSAQARELEAWERPLESYSDEELTALYADYAEEALQLAEVGINEYAQHLRELDKA